MNTIRDEIMRITRARGRAFNHICRGEYQAAEETLESIRHSFCVSESIRAVAPLRAYMMREKGKIKEAQELLRDNMCYLWGDQDSLFIMRVNNPLLTSESNHYHLGVRGGLVRLGLFTEMSAQDVLTVDVVADSKLEAIKFIDGICHCSDPNSRTIVFWKQKKEMPGDLDRKGVYAAYPFTATTNPGEMIVLKSCAA